LRRSLSSSTYFPFKSPLPYGRGSVKPEHRQECLWYETKKATSRIFYPRWWPSETLPKRPQAGPDTVTKIITLLTRIGDSAMRRGRDRVGFAFNIAYVQSTGSVREMQGWIGINKFYRGIRWVPFAIFVFRHAKPGYGSESGNLDAGVRKRLTMLSPYLSIPLGGKCLAEIFGRLSIVLLDLHILLSS
jgi:hypothetical protein